jgi:hypothetical protein
VIEAAKLAEPWRFYDAKSTCLTGLERLGALPHVVEAVANHAPSGVTRRHYAQHDYLDEKRDALERWGAHVERLDPTVKGDVLRFGGGRR